jgi:hypothetical protein
MTKIHHIPNDEAMNTYRDSLTGERFGWVIYQHPSSFSPVHSVQMDPEAGPVVIFYDEVWEVDPDVDTVFRTEDEARDKFWEERSRT